MDYSTIIVAVLGLIGSVIGSYATGSKTKALILYRLEALEKKQDKHNGLIERTYKNERDIATAFTKIDELHEDVQELKHHD